FPFVYFVYLEGSRGQTVGKQLVNIVVVTEDGDHIGYGEAVVRTLLRMIDAIGFVFPYLVGLLLIATSDRGQRLGDRLAGTVVVRTE
ncbi:MAG: RDD family protein, partial [Halobaculum sp.]